MAKKDDESPDKAEPTQKKKKKKGGKLLILLTLVVVVAVAAGAYVFLFSGGKSAAATPAPPQPGIVVKLDSINLNLAGGHYLKLGLALQTVKGTTADQIDGSQTLDEAITLFTGQQMSALSNAVSRDKIKSMLVTKVKKLYDAKVMDVYFTEFVMQ